MSTQKNIIRPDKLANIKYIFNTMPFLLPTRIYFIILILSFILLGVTFKRLPPLVPLYYSLPWGEEQLVRSDQLFIIPFSMLVVFITNLIIILTIVKKDRFLTLLVLWGVCFFSLMGIITLVKIVFLVL